MNVRAFGISWLFRAGARRTARPRARRREAAAALAAGVVAFVAVQAALGAVSAVSRWLADPVFADKEVRLGRFERAAAPGAARVVLLGTSRAGYGFAAGDAEAVAAEAGVRATAFNFGVPGGGPVTQLVYLRRLLAGGHRPDLLVVEVLPALLSDAPSGPIEGRMLKGDLLTREEIELASRYGLPADRLRRQWRDAALLPVYEHRFKLVSRVLPNALPWQLRFDGGRTPDPNGWCPSFANEVSDAERARLAAAVAVEYHEAVTHDIPAGGAAAALRGLLETCRRERLPVALVLFPEGSAFRALYPPETEPKLQRYLSALGAEFGCPVTDARRWIADELFIDSHHLLRPGAVRFTDRFVREAIVPLLTPRPSRGERE